MPGKKSHANTGGDKETALIMKQFKYLHTSMTNGFETLAIIVKKEVKNESKAISLMDEAMLAYKAKCFKEAGANKLLHSTWTRIIETDVGLSRQHHRIITYLLSRYDDQTDTFHEAHFSDIVRNAHIGRGHAKRYLDHLVEKKYITKRKDGYRVFYRLNI